MKTNEVVQKAQEKGFTMRAAASTDSPAVKKVAINAYPTGWEKNADDCVHYTNLEKGSGSLSCVVLEKNSDKSIVGYIFFKKRGSDLYISDTAVDPPYHNQRLGVLLMAYAVAWGKESSLDRVTLYTSKDDKGKEMQQVYRAIGFKNIIFGYTTDEDERDSKSYPMTVPMETAYSGIDAKAKK